MKISGEDRDWLAERGAAMTTTDIPAHILESLTRYVEDGVPLGGFLEAAVANDLVGAASRADTENASALAAIAGVLDRQTWPCWGSRRVYHAWLEYHLARRSGDHDRLLAAQQEVTTAWNEARSRR